MEKKIRVGTYIRLKYGIANVKAIIKSYEPYDVYELNKEIYEEETNGYSDIAYPQEILKYSNIIQEILESGDIVEIEYSYYSVNKEIRKTEVFEVKRIDEENIYFEGIRIGQMFYSKGDWNSEDKERHKPVIKSIMTKEQFKKERYEV